MPDTQEAPKYFDNTVGGYMRALTYIKTVLPDFDERKIKTISQMESEVIDKANELKYNGKWKIRRK